MADNESFPKTTLFSKMYVAPDVNNDLTPIIFLHPLLGTMEIWEDIPQDIADATKRRVYTYDARNHGENEPAHDFSFDQNVDDLFMFMKEIKADTAILVGHCMGGTTAIRAALREPSKIEKFISVEMYVKNMPSDLIDEITFKANKYRTPIAALSEGTKLERGVTTESEKTLPKDQHRKLGKKFDIKENFLSGETDQKNDLKRKYNADAVLQFLSKYEKLEEKIYKDLEASGTQYKKPAYFIYATNSQYAIQSEKENIIKYFPEADFVEIYGASHLLFRDEPAVFTKELIKCLQK